MDVKAMQVSDNLTHISGKCRQGITDLLHVETYLQGAAKVLAPLRLGL